MKDLSRRIIISLTLAVIIMGGMSFTLSNIPSSSNGDIIQVTK